MVRELEFTQKNVPRQVLIDSLNEALKMVKKSLISIPDETLKKDYPVLKFSKTESNEYLLVHLAIHLGYHLGQINYHRLLIDN